VGKGGVEPPRPYGHTDLNRARLPFRHLPAATRDPAAAVRKIIMSEPTGSVLLTGSVSLTGAGKYDRANAPHRCGGASMP
jgi:hypothetical protein